VIADDEAVLAETVSLFLKRDGYKVFWASDGVQAAKLIEENKPDLVLADLVMPNMDGLQLLEWMRDHRSLDRVRFILMTVKDSVLEPLKRHQIEADGYLSKPFDKSAMMQTVHRIIGKA
jgi:DNA-binding response OmpR family regulator